MKKILLYIALIIVIPLVNSTVNAVEEQQQEATNFLKHAFQKSNYNPVHFIDAISKEVKGINVERKQDGTYQQVGVYKEVYEKVIVEFMAQVLVTGKIDPYIINPQLQQSQQEQPKNFGGIQNKCYGVNDPNRKTLGDAIRRVRDAGQASFLEDRAKHYAGDNKVSLAALKGILLYSRYTQPWMANSIAYDDVLGRGHLSEDFKDDEGNQYERYSADKDVDSVLVFLNIKRSDAVALLLSNKAWLENNNIFDNIKNEFEQLLKPSGIIHPKVAKILGYLSGFNIYFWLESYKNTNKKMIEPYDEIKDYPVIEGAPNLHIMYGNRFGASLSGPEEAPVISVWNSSGLENDEYNFCSILVPHNSPNYFMERLYALWKKKSKERNLDQFIHENNFPSEFELALAKYLIKHNSQPHSKFAKIEGPKIRRSIGNGSSTRALEKMGYEPHAHDISFSRRRFLKNLKTEVEENHAEELLRWLEDPNNELDPNYIESNTTIDNTVNNDRQFAYEVINQIIRVYPNDYKHFNADAVLNFYDRYFNDQKNMPVMSLDLANTIVKLLQSISIND